MALDAFDPGKTFGSRDSGNNKLTRDDIFSALSDDTGDENKTDDESTDDEINLGDDKVDESDSTDEVDDEKDDDDESVESDDEVDEEVNLDDADEDELELAKIPRRAEIKAKYPNIFKEFPALDHIFHREKAYSEVFPTLADAKSAKEEIDSYNSFKGELLNGDLEGVLKSVKSTDEKAYNKIAGNYLQTLYKVDPAAHLKITNDVLKGALKFIHDSVKDAGKDSSEEQVLFSVRILNKAIYGSTEVKGPDVTSRAKEDEVDPEKVKLQTERQQFEKTKLNEAVSDVTSRVESTIKSYVEKNIDPRNTLPEYVRNKLIEDVMNSLDKNLKSESRYMSVINRLWIKAKENNYSSESRAKIRKTVLDKTKTLLPSIMRSKKAEAMRGLGMRRRNEEVDESSQNNKEVKRETSSGKKTTSTRRDNDRLVPRQGESARDFLMRD